MGACQPANACGFKTTEKEFTGAKQVTYATKYDRVMDVLRKLKLKAERYNDPESVSELQWVITALLDKDIFEPEIEHFANGAKDEQEKEKLDIIGTYTNIHRNTAIKDDTRKVNQLIQEEHEKAKKPVRYEGFINKFKKSVSNIVISLEKKENYALKTLTPEQISGVATVISKIDTYDFNIFELNKYAGKTSIYFVLNQTFQRCGLFKIIPEQRFVSFCKELAEGYNRDVIYHNDLHGADVCQTAFLITEKGNLFSKLMLGDIDKIALLTAGAAHDFKHNGFTNNFHVLRSTEMALTYNDSTVLENMHVSETFKILARKDNNFLELFRPEEYRHIRRRIIDCILGTDMARHVQQKSQLKSLLETHEIKGGLNLGKILVEDHTKKFENQQLILTQVIHTADLLNPGKVREVADRWMELVYQEFFAQGDVEKSLNMPFSPLCDRKTVKKNKSQVGFIQYVVLPQIEQFLEVIPEISFFRDSAITNLERYKVKQIDEDKVN